MTTYIDTNPEAKELLEEVHAAVSGYVGFSNDTYNQLVEDFNEVSDKYDGLLASITRLGLNDVIADELVSYDDDELEVPAEEASFLDLLINGLGVFVVSADGSVELATNDILDSFFMGALDDPR